MNDFFFKCWMRFKQSNPLAAHNIEMETAGYQPIVDVHEEKQKDNDSDERIQVL